MGVNPYNAKKSHSGPPPIPIDTLEKIRTAHVLLHNYITRFIIEPIAVYDCQANYMETFYRLNQVAEDIAHASAA
jgi:hypothetical protein